MNKHYLGDGVYIEMQEKSDIVEIYTDKGNTITNLIYLDSDVLASLIEYIKRNLPNFWDVVKR